MRTTPATARFQSRRLSAYAAGTAGLATMLTSQQSEAAVTACTFDFGTVLNNSTSGYGYNHTSTGGTLKVSANSSYLSMGSNLGIEGQVYMNLYRSSMGPVKFLSYGTVLGGGTSSGDLGQAFFSASPGSALNLGADQLNQNIGFRDGNNHYGWANVSYDSTNKAVTINSAYIQTTAGAPITIGDMGSGYVGAAPEPGRALLMLAGLGGMALRRRRKSAC